MSNREVIILDGDNVSIEDIVKISRFGCQAKLADASVEKINKSRKVVEDIVEKEIRTYGINTGFGRLSTVAISKPDIEKLQKNLIMSHSTGLGALFSTEIVRAMMALRVNALAKGFSGIRLSTLQTLLDMLNKGVHPSIPERGSVGASGDLCPLSHMVLPMIGLGEAEYQGEILPGAEAMKRAGIPLVTLKAKEGLALNNGTCSMMAAGVLATYDALIAAKTADIAAALSLEALEGVIDAFDPRIHAARPHKGQIESAANVAAITKGSRMTTRQGEKRIQDAYSVRCVPAIHGGSRLALDYVADVVTTEINSVTDNPLIFIEENGSAKALSGCNFHGQPIAIAMDVLGIAMSELADVCERRTERMLNPALNNGLPAFLTKDSGLNSGLMQVQFPSASTASENKVLAHPASVDSIPTSGNQEDHVSMGTIAARKAYRITQHALELLGLELLCGAQAADFRGSGRLAPVTRAVYDMIRREVPFVAEDVYLYPLMQKCVAMVKDERVVKTVEALTPLY